MNVISTSWSCQRCGATCICDPPWHRLCDPCLAGLQALVRHALPETGTCPSSGGPVCPDCGDAMPILVPVPVPASTPVAGQLTGLLIGYQGHPQGGTSDDH
jgi:hypothetical protein